MSLVIQCTSPIDGSIYAERPIAPDKEIEKALREAAQAQRQWRKTPLIERIEICRKALSYFLDRTSDIARELTWQMGRPIQYTPFEISKGFRERAEYMLSIAPEALADKRIENSPGYNRFIRRAPLGTVLVLAPWNYPYLTSVNVIFPAILSGNTVLLKHSEQTLLCAERYAEAFREAGLPGGVFQFLHLTHEQTSRMISDHRVDYVAFTGSVRGGRAVKKAIGERFIAASLELGGKDPAYVRSDADLEFAIENLVDGSFFNSGQSCCAVERIYVDQSIFPAFVEGFVELTKKYKLGNPLLESTDLGPLVRTSAADFARRQVRQALDRGAKSLIPADHFGHQQPGSPYLAPQVLIDVDHSMDVMTEETFAPVIGIMPVQNDLEAIQLMNDSRYGLTASIWSADAATAIQIGNELETGTCFLNRCDYLDPALAWTGVKDSGRGCSLSSLGYNELTRPKSFHLRQSR